MAKIFVSFTIVSTGNFFLVARENSNPSAEVFRSALLIPPHANRNLTIDNINPVMHRVELWSTVDNVNLSQLRGRGDIDASQYTQLAFDSFDFVVDRGFTGAPNYDPVSTPGSNTEYVNPDLAGKTYLVFKPGFGPLLWDAHIEKRTDINGVDQGGFRFINGQEFATGEEYTVMISNLTTVYPTNGGTGSGGFPTGVELVQNSVNFADTYYRKVIEVEANSNITITITDIDLIPENTVFAINTHSSTNANFRNVTLQLPSGKYCMVNGVQRNAVYICRSESVTFIKKGAYLRVVNWDGDYRRIGQRIYSDRVAPANGIALLGGWYSKSDIIRLWSWYLAYLLPGDYITGYADDSDPAPYWQRWIFGTNKVWVPDHGGFFYRHYGVNNVIDPEATTRAWNSPQGSANLSHNHTSPGAWDKMGARASDVGGYGVPYMDGSNASPSTKIRAGQWTNGEWLDATVIPQGGYEARPSNVAVANYIII